MQYLFQVAAFEATSQTEEREYFPLKARQLATDWEMRQHKARLGKNAMLRQHLLTKCEGYCRELRQALRQHEDLEAQARDMYELDHARVPDHDAVEGGARQLGNVGTRSVFRRKLSKHCGWQRLLPFFKLGGWVAATASEVTLELCAFNNRALVGDLEELCRNVNTRGATLPGGRRLVMAVGKRPGCLRDGPLAQIG